MYKYRESQDRYLAKFKMITLRLHREHDADLIDWLSSKPSVNQFVKDLLKREFVCEYKW